MVYVLRKWFAAFLLNFVVVISALANTDITVENPYVRETIPGTSSSAAYMVIKNRSDKDVKLLAATSNISKRIELHQHLMQDGMMKMREVEGITVPANSSVVLQPSGYHIMIFALQNGVKAGEKVPFSLLFSDNQTVEVIATVESIKQKKHHHHHHH